MDQPWHTSEELQKKLLDFHKEKAYFPRKEVEEAKQHHVKTMNTILTDLKEKGVAKQLEFTGSSYEGIKVPSTDMEFDVMVVLSDKKGISADAVTPLYHKLSTGPTTEPLPKITGGTDNNIIMPKKTCQYFCGQLQRVVDKHAELKDVVKLRNHGPAVQMDIYRDGSKSKLFYSVDMVPSIQVPRGGRYYVAKPFKEDPAQEQSLDTWRLSFSPHEKAKISNIDIGNQCSKQIMRTLKVIRDKEPGLHGINSYMIKTSVISMDPKRDGSMSWCQPVLAARFIDSLKHLTESLETGQLPHYYVPKFNLLGSMSEKHRENMACRLKELVRSEKELYSVLKCEAPTAQEKQAKSPKEGKGQENLPKQGKENRPKELVQSEKKLHSVLKCEAPTAQDKQAKSPKKEKGQGNLPKQEKENRLKELLRSEKKLPSVLKCKVPTAQGKQAKSQKNGKGHENLPKQEKENRLKELLRSEKKLPSVLKCKVPTAQGKQAKSQKKGKGQENLPKQGKENRPKKLVQSEKKLHSVLKCKAPTAQGKQAKSQNKGKGQGNLPKQGKENRPKKLVQSEKKLHSVLKCKAPTAQGKQAKSQKKGKGQGNLPKQGKGNRQTGKSSGGKGSRPGIKKSMSKGHKSANKSNLCGCTCVLL